MVKLIKVGTIGDGSCLLHAIVQAISPFYSNLDDTEKMRLIRNVRKDLSNILDESRGDKDSTWYDFLSRGQLEEISTSVPEASKKHMKKILDSNSWLSYQYIELLSEIFEIDIYIIDYSTNSLYNLGDDELLYKNRDSIIIGYIPNCHFETLAVSTDEGEKKTYFSPSSDIIIKMKNLLHTNRLNNYQN